MLRNYLYSANYKKTQHFFSRNLGVKLIHSFIHQRIKWEGECGMGHRSRREEKRREMSRAQTSRANLKVTPPAPHSQPAANMMCAGGGRDGRTGVRVRGCLCFFLPALLLPIFSLLFPCFFLACCRVGYAYIFFQCFYCTLLTLFNFLSFLASIHISFFHIFLPFSLS